MRATLRPRGDRGSSTGDHSRRSECSRMAVLVKSDVHDARLLGRRRQALHVPLRGFAFRSSGNSLHVEPTSTFSYTMPDRLEALTGLRTELRAWLSDSGVDRETAD